MKHEGLISPLYSVFFTVSLSMTAVMVCPVRGRLSMHHSCCV